MSCRRGYVHSVAPQQRLEAVHCAGMKTRLAPQYGCRGYQEANQIRVVDQIDAGALKMRLAPSTNRSPVLAVSCNRRDIASCASSVFFGKDFAGGADFVTSDCNFISPTYRHIHHDGMALQLALWSGQALSAQLLILELFPLIQ